MNIAMNSTCLANGVLIASSSMVFRKQIRSSLSIADQPVLEALGGADALGKLESGRYQVLFLDRRLPDLDPDELLRTIRNRYPAVEVVLLDSDNARPLPVVERATAEPACPENESPLPGMIGRGPSMRKVYRLVRLVAKRECTVIVTGSTGTGKELVARAIHTLSRRARGPLVIVNCAALPETLMESELFGYSRGAFTGAVQAKGGRIEAAQGGTLFLDEIGEVPLAVQSKLLRFLEQREVQRLGSSEALPVNVRVVAATNVDLARLVREGKFREDLLYRLSVFPIELPLLKQRAEDILPLAEHFLREASGVPNQRMNAEFVRVLRSHSWPGNVRELRHVVERASILADGSDVLREEHIYFPTSGWLSPSRP